LKIIKKNVVIVQKEQKHAKIRMKLWNANLDLNWLKEIVSAQKEISLMIRESA
jgi:hypothetical protein